MNVFQIRDKLKQRLAHLNVDFKFDREDKHYVYIDKTIIKV